MPFVSLKTPKIKILKNEKICWRYHHFTHVYQKSQSYDVWFLRYGVRQTKIFVIWAIFCPFCAFFTPLMIPQIKILKKKKRKKCLEILSFYTYMCTINEDHMIYGSWNIRCDRQKFLSFWAIFCPFSPLTTWKIKILTLKKTPGDIIILHICTINDNHMMYGSWDMECNGQNFLSFWTIFCPFTAQKIKILKKWKTRLEISSFYICVPKIMIRKTASSEIKCYLKIFVVTTWLKNNYNIHITNISQVKPTRQWNLVR